MLHLPSGQSMCMMRMKCSLAHAPLSCQLADGWVRWLTEMCSYTQAKGEAGGHQGGAAGAGLRDSLGHERL